MQLSLPHTFAFWSRYIIQGIHFLSVIIIAFLFFDFVGGGNPIIIFIFFQLLNHCKMLNLEAISYLISAIYIICDTF